MLDQRASDKQSRELLKNRKTATIITAFLGFIGLGLTAGLLGLAWPSMQQEFGLQLDSVNALYLMQTTSYTLASFFCGRLFARFGSGTSLLAGAVILGLCMLGMAAAPAWLLIIGLALIAGFGSGVLDAGLNLYVATYHSARTMNWLHASFGVGVTIGPLIMTFVLEQKLGWHVGYAIVGILLLAIVGAFALVRRAWRIEGLQTAENKPVQRVGFSQSLRRPVIWFSMAIFLAYVGLEIGVGQWAYTLMTQSRGMDPGIVGLWVSIYWGVFTGGRIFFGLIADRFPITQILRLCMLSIIIGAALFWWNPVNEIGLLGLIILGIAEAPVFPLLMTDTAQRVGMENTENGISLQMAAVGIGTALLPGLIGTIGKNFGLETMTLTFLILAVSTFIFHEFARLTSVSARLVTTTGD